MDIGEYNSMRSPLETFTTPQFRNHNCNKVYHNQTNSITSLSFEVCCRTRKDFFLADSDVVFPCTKREQQVLNASYCKIVEPDLIHRITSLSTSGNTHYASTTTIPTYIIDLAAPYLTSNFSNLQSCHGLVSLQSFALVILFTI